LRDSIKPTGHEIKMTDNDFIVSKTDAKGKITYGNRDFMRFSGLTENDFIGKAHNIVRHPDMPRAVYQIMWNNLFDKKEFFGFIKNIHTSGSYYWTFANITPSYDDDGKVIGYFSVRRKAYDSAISFFEETYKHLKEEENRHSNKKEAIAASMNLLLEIIYKDSSKGYDEFMFSG
jgi:PAS domain S-box-containing protein